MADRRKTGLGGVVGGSCCRDLESEEEERSEFVGLSSGSRDAQESGGLSGFKSEQNLSSCFVERGWTEIGRGSKVIGKGGG